ncbi:DEAD/DEAH box helicase [Chlorogloeopsis sp. ULAP01]|uniref:DEAD/DEAH box helicase n=1 Tax=Chlorogloeopsis sp. ULAP01 TaxID=3056483 RepID=UPI0025AA7866|nr:DEAD/DEAH box helicase [Chlorogloeopsis sp. ULAP01]MDM9383538.1 DEAD/DEAH box helicase [Chlorogloeopsis sp. ULAP01]
MSNRPEWLQPSRSIYSRQHGIIQVSAIIGDNLYFRKGVISQTIFNWEEEIKKGNLSQIQDTPSSKSFIYQEIATDIEGRNKLAYCDVIPEQAANLEPIPDSIHSAVNNAINQLGINQLYSHQIEAWEAYNQGNDIILETPTSSGKSISFLLPVIHECFKGNSCIIFFNLKALAFDQEEKIREFVNLLPESIRPAILNINGDTPSQERKKLYTHKPSIICVTPDVWHHELNNYQFDNYNFVETLRKISIIVVDELHFYSGIFGANFALLNRRTQLIIEQAGGNLSQLKYIYASATINNSQEIAQKISNRRENLTVISQSGARKAQTTFISLKPQNSVLYTTAQIAALLVSKDVVGICFCDSRETVKTLTQTIRKILVENGLPHLKNTISAFYANLKNNQRRKIIADIKSGDVKFIVSTSALEAGLDLGCIDAVLICKYPGSILSFRQRAGRAGRKEEGLIVFIPSRQSILDSYYSNHPERLLIDPPEVINFNPNFENLLQAHILACCKESRPTINQIAKHFGQVGVAIANQLLEDKKLVYSFNNKLACARHLGYIHGDIKIRGSRSNNIDYINTSTGEEFEQSAVNSALREVHPDAIYIAQDFDGNPVWYRSLELKIKEGQAFLKPTSQTNLFTRPQGAIRFEEVKTTGEEKLIQLSKGVIKLTPKICKISESVSGYKLYNRELRWTCPNRDCRNHNQFLASKLENCSICNSQLTERDIIQLVEEVPYKEALTISYSTTCLEVEIDLEAKNLFKSKVDQIRSVIKNQKYISREERELFEYKETDICIHSLAHQLMLALPLVEHGASSKDIDFILHEEPRQPNLVGYFFDTVEGGTGMCDTLFQYLEKAISKAQFLVENCPCKHGCSNCTVIYRCPDDNTAISKQVGLSILQYLIQQQVQTL